jgi:hypothetical protein
MSIFGLSKLWSWIVLGATVLALIGGLYAFAVHQGHNKAVGQVAKHNVEVVEVARKADDIVIRNIITETKVIERQTQEVKEVIREVPETGLNPVSRARLERVREQQRLAAEASADSNGDNSSVQERASGSADRIAEGL